MSQNPYAHVEPSGLGGGYDDIPNAPERTSVLAITSLVLSILAVPACCVAVGMVPGLLGAFVGIVALVMIAKSNGRLGGRGLAITGVVMGLVFSLLSIIVVFGLVKFTDMWSAYTDAVVYAEQGDATKLRGMLNQTAGSALTDERVAEWATEIDLEWGKADPADGLGDLFQQLVEAGPLMENAQMVGDYPSNQIIPVPLRFTNGTTVLVVVMDENQPMSSGMPAMRNVGVLDDNGDPIWLIDPDLSP